jgi:hypothetical protein
MFVRCSKKIFRAQPPRQGRGWRLDSGGTRELTLLQQHFSVQAPMALDRNTLAVFGYYSRLFPILAFIFSFSTTLEHSACPLIHAFF